MAETSLVERFRRRKVVQWTVAYAVVALGLMEFVDGFGARWGVTDDAQRLLDVALIVGLAVTIVLAWFHGERGRQRVGALEVGALGVVLLVGAFLGGRLDDSAAPESVPVLDQDGLAVRPLVALSPGDESESFAVSIHSELNSVLGRELVTRVIATSAMRGYTDDTRSSGEIAAELGVRHVLTGDVRVSGEIVRLNVELVDRAGTFVWGRSYDAERAPSRMLAIQQEIAAEIASELALEIRNARFATASGENAAAAYTLYQQGVARVQQVEDVGGEARDAVWTLAIDLFAQAARLDPGFVPALAQHSIQLASWTNRGTAPRTSMTGAQIDSVYAIALESAERANALAPDNPDAIASMASYRYFADRDYPTAIDLADRALALDPSNLDATLWRAAAYRRMGNLTESALGFQQVIRLDPRGAQMREELIRTLGGDRRFSEALAVADGLERLNANGAWTLRSQLAALLGDTAAIRRAADVCPECGSAQLNAALYLEPHRPVSERQDVSGAYAAELSGDTELATSLYRQATTELEARVGIQGVWCPGVLCPNRIHESRQLAFARAKLGDTEGARHALAWADSLAAIEPRDLWAAPDFTPWKLWTAVVLEDRVVWTRELEGLLSVRTNVEGIMTPALAGLDPRLESVRDDPEFEAIVAR